MNNLPKIVFTLCVLCVSFVSLSQDSLSIDEVFDRKTLPEFCDSFPTDKCGDKHNFVEIYEQLFSPIRQDTIRFFEIGILNGVSHLMWRTYFRNARIYGIDIHDYSRQSAGTGIMTFVADQSDRNDLAAFIDTSGGDFDIILDDGGHAMDHQQVSLGYLFKHLNPGGMFIIEDVHTSLPEYYPDDFFNVNQLETNTTLFMIEWFVRKNEIRSEFMTQEEIRYLEENIERVEVHYRTNNKHSIVVIIHKKG